MALQIGDNFSYKGRKPLDTRLTVNDIATLTGLPENTLYDGILVYVSSEKKFYVYNSNNSDELVIHKWRELTTAGINISTAEINNDKTSSTYGHLFLTLVDGTILDCGNAIGEKGEKGDGFAISKIYENITDILTDPNPVDEGSMIALIENDISTGDISARIFIRHEGTESSDKNLPNYLYFCNLEDATIIRGPKGDQGVKGDKGDSPIITISPIVATQSTPAGQKITFSINGQSDIDYIVYNGTNGIDINGASINTNGELILSFSNGTTINVGKIKEDANNIASCITILGVYDNSNIPTTFPKESIYYNIDTNSLYHAVAANTWDTQGTLPKENTVYISINNKKVYAYTNGVFDIYGGNTDISKEELNAIENKKDGIYVKDLTEEVKRINIAQKTVNELGYESLLEDPSQIFTLKVGTNRNGSSTNTILNKTLELKKSILDYNYLKFVIETKNDDTGNANWWLPFYQEVRVSDIIFYPGETNHNNGGSTFILIAGIDAVTPYCSGLGHVIFKCWFKDDKHLFIYRGSIVNELNASWAKWRIKDIVGIKKETTVIDPINYLNKNGNLEDTPVGTIINYMGINAPNHYLICDGSEYNINDYRELAQHFKQEFGSYNYFGGNGTTTFAVPDLRGEFLRGSGTAARKTGTGNEVGLHQDPTNHIGITSAKNFWIMVGSPRGTANDHVTNDDSHVKGYGLFKTGTNVSPNNTDYIASYTSRPTNTAVQYAIKYEQTFHAIFGDQTTYKVSVPLSYSFTPTSRMTFPVFDNSKAEDDISMLSNISGQGDAFVAPMDGYYLANFMTPEQIDIPGNPIEYHATYIYKDTTIIGGSDRQDNSTNIRVPSNESFLIKLKKGEKVTLGFYINGQNDNFTLKGTGTFALVNCLQENKALEVYSKSELWPYDTEMSFGNNEYGIRLKFENITDGSFRIDMSKYNINKIIRIEGNGIVDIGETQIPIPCYYTPNSFASVHYNTNTKTLYLVRGSIYCKPTDIFDIRIWYTK